MGSSEVCDFLTAEVRGRSADRRSLCKRTVGKLAINQREKCNKRDRIRASRIHRNMVLPSSLHQMKEGDREADCNADRSLHNVEV